MGPPPGPRLLREGSRFWFRVPEWRGGLPFLPAGPAWPFPVAWFGVRVVFPRARLAA